MPSWSEVLKEYEGSEITVHMKEAYQTSTMVNSATERQESVEKTQSVRQSTPADGVVERVKVCEDGSEFVFLRQDIPEELRAMAGGVSSQQAIIPGDAIAFVGVGSAISMGN